MGVNIVAYKIVAFAIAGFLAGVSGGMMAASVGQLDGRAFAASESIMLFALTVIAARSTGRDRSLPAAVARRTCLLTDFHVDGNLAIMVFGVGLLHALITAPQGVSGQVVALSRKIITKVTDLTARTAEKKA